jgi:hypothetical protein
MKPEPVIRYGGQQLKLRQFLSRYVGGTVFYGNLGTIPWPTVPHRTRRNYVERMKKMIPQLLAANGSLTLQRGNVVEVFGPETVAAANSSSHSLAVGANVVSAAAAAAEPAAVAMSEIPTDPEPQTSPMNRVIEQNVPQLSNFVEEEYEAGTALPIDEFASIPFLIILRLWAVICQIPATQMDLLMRLLKKNNNYREFLELPKSWKTVMKSRDEVKTKHIVEDWGTPEKKIRMSYLGIENRLNQYKHLYVKEGSRGECFML